jgi:hypothetical protein
MAVSVAVSVAAVGGSAAAAGASTSSAHRAHAGVVHVSGVVTAVNGTAKPTACGVAGTPGSFSVADARSTTSSTVAVTATTRFFVPRRPDATFASVCVGESVLARGTTVSGELSASAVFVYPQGPVLHASGVVTAVNGTAKATSCGVAGTSGFFAVANPKSNTSRTVDVTATTRFFEPPMKPGVALGPKGPNRSNTSFASVCVGESVLVRGTLVSGVLSAIAVFVFPRHPVVHASGVVTAVTVTGTTTTPTTPTCGGAGTPGTFVVADARSTSHTTVDVTATTRFFEPPMKPGVALGPKGPNRSNATFASVCVGDSVLARGTVVSGVFTATAVFVFPRGKADPPGHTGILASGSGH